ncbi:MAG: hypothetical protein U0U70_04390 [Chitinophagaceae bacterium]
MRKNCLFHAVLSLFLLVPASITWAQTTTSVKGLKIIDLNLPQGRIRLYLPEDTRPGDRISGSVQLEPAGTTEKQRQRSLDDLLKRELKIGDPNDPNQVAQSLLKRYQSDPAAIQLEPVSLPFLTSVTVLNAGKTEFSLPLEMNKSAADQEPVPPVCLWPSHVLNASPFTIKGNFDGDLGNTRCTIGGQNAAVLAESPRQCFVMMPAAAKGLQDAQLNDNRKGPCTTKIAAVDMQVSAGKLNLKNGELTYVDVVITGLTGLQDKATLTVKNNSTGVVTMSPSNIVMIELSPDSIASGRFQQRFDIRSMKTGDFSVTVNLDLPDEQAGMNRNQFDLRDLKNESGYPGSYGYKGDQPCEPEGKTITWRWHKTFPCEIDDRKVLPCGHTKEGNDIYEEIKKLLEELELDKATDIGEKMAKAFSSSKLFSYSIHVIRKWVDYDISYKCVNGKWQATGGVYVKHGTDDLGWHTIKSLTTECWMTFDSPAAEKEFEAALETALRNACK